MSNKSECLFRLSSLYNINGGRRAIVLTFDSQFNVPETHRILGGEACATVAARDERRMLKASVINKQFSQTFLCKMRKIASATQRKLNSHRWTFHLWCNSFRLFNLPTGSECFYSRTGLPFLCTSRELAQWFFVNVICLFLGFGCMCVCVCVLPRGIAEGPAAKVGEPRRNGRNGSLAHTFIWWAVLHVDRGH